MKLKLYTILSFAALAALNASAWDFSAQIGDQYNKITWYFDWVDDAHTMCQTAAATGISIEYGPKQYNPSEYEWHIVDSKGNIKNSWELGSVVPNEINWIIVNNGFPSEVEYNGKMIPIVGIGDYSFTGRVNGSFAIPETVTKIGKGVFYNANQSITLHDNITYIDDFAFFGDGFSSLNLNNLEKLGKYAFAECKDLTDVTIKNTKEIGDHAFYKVSSLKNVTIENVDVVGAYAFTGLQDNQEGWHSASCGNGSATTLMETLTLKNVKRIEKAAFAECHKLKEINIPNTVTYIGDYAFFHCQEACPIKFGNGVEYIGSWAFSGGTYHTCPETSITLPPNLKTIGDHAFTFNNESGVFTDLTIASTTPPTQITDEDGCSAFGYLDPSRLNQTFFNDPAAWVYPYVCLHVPRGSYNAYAREYNEDGTFNPWSQFTCIIDDVIPDEVMSLDEVVGYVYMAPGDVTQVDPNILPGFNERWGNYTGQIDPSWDSEADDVATITEEGRITALKYGKKLAVAKASIGNKIWNGSKFEDVEEIVGVIVIYVCPTVVLATNLNESDLGVAQDNPNIGGDSSAGSSEDDGIHVLADNDTPVIAGAEYPAPATDSYTTYEHLVVPESFPQFKITPAFGFEITNTMHGDANDDKSWKESDLVELVDGDYDTDTDARQEEVAIALEEPITNNRVVYIEINQIEGLDLGTTGVQEFEVGNDMKVRVDGTNIMVEGAEANDVLTVSNLNGQTLVRTTEKSVSVSTPGMYLVTISSKKATTTFKVIAK